MVPPAHARSSRRQEALTFSAFRVSLVTSAATGIETRAVMLRSLASGRGSPHARTVPRLLQVFVWLMLATLLPQPAAATLPFHPAAPPPACDGVYLNPTTGRFWSMDSFEGRGGDTLSLHKYLYGHADPVNNIDPSGNESLMGISLAGTLSQGLHGKYDAGVSTVGNSIKNTIVGVYAGMSVGQIVVLNFLDNAGGVVVGKVIGKIAQLRRLPGVVKGVGKVIQGDRWLRGSHGNAGFVPAQIAQRLAGRNFKNFDKFREAFWQEVAADANLSKGFTFDDLVAMRKGNAPAVDARQALGGRATYELHHAKPIQHGGEVYDVDNIVVVTPRYHKEVLEPAYHY